MDSRWKGFFYVLGIIFAIYLLFRYIIPVIFKMLGCVISLTLKIFMWAVVVLIIIIIFGYIVRMVRSN